MASKSNQKDYKALYNDALNKLKKQDTKLKKQDTKLKEQDTKLKEYEGNGSTVWDVWESYADAWKEIYYLYDELEKYKKAEKAYNEKFGIEETRLTSQEMKEMERRAREDEEDEDEEDEVGNGLYGFCYKCKSCLTEDDDDRNTGFCEECDIKKGHWGFCYKCKNCLTEDDK